MNLMNAIERMVLFAAPRLRTMSRSSLNERPSVPVWRNGAAGNVNEGYELAVWEAAGRDEARIGRPFRATAGGDCNTHEAYSRGYWKETEQIRFEHGDYDLI